MKKLLVLSLVLLSSLSAFAGCGTRSCAPKCADKCTKKEANCNPPAPCVTCVRTWSEPTYVRHIRDVANCNEKSCEYTQRARCTGYVFEDACGSHYEGDASDINKAPGAVVGQ